MLRETLAGALDVAREVCRRYERLDTWWQRVVDVQAVDEYRESLPWDWGRDRAVAKAIEQWAYHYDQLLKLGRQLRPPTDKAEYVDQWPADGRPPRPERSNLTYIWALEVTAGDQEYDRWHPHYHILTPSREAAQLLNAAWQVQRPPTLRSFWNSDIRTKAGAVQRAAHYLAKYIGGSRSGGDALPEDRQSAVLNALRHQRLYSAGGDWAPIGMRYEPEDPVDRISTPLLADRGHWEAWECMYRPELPSAVSHILETRAVAEGLLRGLDEYDEDTVDALEQALDQTQCPDESARVVVQHLRNFSNDRDSSVGAKSRDLQPLPRPPPRPDD